MQTTPSQRGRRASSAPRRARDFNGPRRVYHGVRDPRSPGPSRRAPASREKPLRAAGRARRGSWLSGSSGLGRRAHGGLREPRLDEGLAQLCGAATLARARRRGIQPRFCVTACRGRHRGCVLALVTTRPGGGRSSIGGAGFALLYGGALLVEPAASPAVAAIRALTSLARGGGQRFFQLEADGALAGFVGLELGLSASTVVPLIG